jgi:hypothetical protein
LSVTEVVLEPLRGVHLGGVSSLAYRAVALGSSFGGGPGGEVATEFLYLFGGIDPFALPFLGLGDVLDGVGIFDSPTRDLDLPDHLADRFVGHRWSSFLEKEYTKNEFPLSEEKKEKVI